MRIPTTSDYIVTKIFKWPISFKSKRNKTAVPPPGMQINVNVAVDSFYCAWVALTAAIVRRVKDFPTGNAESCKREKQGMVTAVSGLGAVKGVRFERDPH